MYICYPNLEMLCHNLMYTWLTYLLHTVEKLVFCKQIVVSFICGGLLQLSNNACKQFYLNSNVCLVLLIIVHAK